MVKRHKVTIGDPWEKDLALWEDNPEEKVYVGVGRIPDRENITLRFKAASMGHAEALFVCKLYEEDSPVDAAWGDELVEEMDRVKAVHGVAAYIDTLVVEEQEDD